MADLETRLIATERLLERTRQKHKKEIDRLHRQLRQKDQTISFLTEEDAMKMQTIRMLLDELERAGVKDMSRLGEKS